MMITGNPLVFVDTSVFVAFFNRQDQYHKQALDLLVLQKNPIFILDAVLHESLALLRKRVGKDVAVQAAQQLQDSHFCTLFISPKNMLIKALSLFIEKRGKYSYADCILVLEAQSRDGGILSFDRHFRDFEILINQ